MIGQNGYVCLSIYLFTGIPVIVKAAVSKFGLPWDFWVKVINVNFQLGEYMQFKENEVSNFFLQY